MQIRYRISRTLKLLSETKTSLMCLPLPITRTRIGLPSSIYGRAFSEQCARGVSALNTWSRVWPWILIWAYLIWNFEPIFGQQISILDPPPLTLDFLVRLGLNFYPVGELGWWWLGRRHFFVMDGQKRDYLSRASQRARGATKKLWRPELYATKYDRHTYNDHSNVSCSETEKTETRLP